MSQKCSTTGCTRWAFDHGLCRFVLAASCSDSIPHVARADGCLHRQHHGGYSPPPVVPPRSSSPPPPSHSPQPAAGRAFSPFGAVMQPPTPIDFNRDLPTCPDVTLSCASSSNDICITLQAVDKPQRVPTHCIIVMDVSGSMDSRATQPDASDGEGGSVVFTRLDLAKHSSKVIVEVMSDTDSVTIISFGSTALVELGQTHMTAAGKQQAHGVIERLCTAGSTNLIAANDLALQQAALDIHSTNIHIVLLTDGEPDDVGNVLPKLRFTARSLENERISGRHNGFCFSTFGFGFNMNSVRTQPAPHAAIIVHNVLCRNCFWK